MDAHWSTTLVERVAAWPEVVALALAGSRGAGTADERSDADLYVYADGGVPVERRTALARELAAGTAEIDNRFWETGDEWTEAASGVHVDLMYRSPAWITDQLDRVLVRHEASRGYSTALWHNVLASRALFERDGWYTRLQRRADQPYPEPLRRAVVAKNHPVLRTLSSSYATQIASAVAREDRVSVLHRTAALLDSYFDVLFAVNRVPHPGEKRQLAFAASRCRRLPAGMVAGVERVVAAAGQPDGEVSEAVHDLLDALDAMIRDDGLPPPPGSQAYGDGYGGTLPPS